MSFAIYFPRPSNASSLPAHKICYGYVIHVGLVIDFMFTAQPGSGWCTINAVAWRPHADVRKLLFHITLTFIVYSPPHRDQIDDIT